MGWAANYIRQLQDGKTITFRPRGNSMTPVIKNGQEVTVIPAVIEKLAVGDIVLCTVAGNDYLHFIKAINSEGKFQIGNNRGFINGWTKKVYGVVTNGTISND